MANKKPEKLDLEKALAELENLVEKMESEKLSLEESLKLFEHGVTLTKACQKTLTEAEQKVQQLITKNNQSELIDVDTR
jgi:exodeoxyribonuclease VII small subunit